VTAPADEEADEAEDDEEADEDGDKADEVEDEDGDKAAKGDNGMGSTIAFAVGRMEVAVPGTAVVAMGVLVTVAATVGAPVTWLDCPLDAFCLRSASSLAATTAKTASTVSCGMPDMARPPATISRI